jgi:hypothetical protein
MQIILGVVTKMYAIAYKEGRRIRKKARNLLCATALSALVTAIPAVGAEAQKGETAVTCTNPYSGVTWQISIDYDKKTVDANPARMSDSEISWRDRTDGSNYTLDRKSGNLTVIIASSTGGFFLHDRCKLDN